jgi:hypothetical protein
LLQYPSGCPIPAAHLLFHPSDEDLLLGTPACRKGEKAQIQTVRDLSELLLLRLG